MPRSKVRCLQLTIFPFCWIVTSDTPALNSVGKRGKYNYINQTTGNWNFKIRESATVLQNNVVVVAAQPTINPLENLPPIKNQSNPLETCQINDKYDICIVIDASASVDLPSFRGNINFIREKLIPELNLGPDKNQVYVFSQSEMNSKNLLPFGDSIQRTKFWINDPNDPEISKLSTTSGYQITQHGDQGDGLYLAYLNCADYLHGDHARA